jgi:dTDP-4-dehydrorhamnose 3,5-epimerase-like enzyme
MYKVDQYYNKDCDISIRFDDPEINIKWPDLKYIVSEKDENGINLSEYEVETK